MNQEKNIQAYFIRHGDVEPTLDDSGQLLVYGRMALLSSLGKDQMNALAKVFKDQGTVFDVVYTSPYYRTIHSASLIIQNMPLAELFPIYNLRDVDPNSAIGKPMSMLKPIHADIYAHPLGPEQETLEHLTHRAGKVLEDILSYSLKFSFLSIAVVSHGDLLSALLWYLRHKNTPPSYAEMVKNFYLEKGQALPCIFSEDLALKTVEPIISAQEVERSREDFRIEKKDNN